MAETTADSLDVQQLLVGSGGDVDRYLRVRQAQGQSPEQRRQLERLIIELIENPTVDGKPLSSEDAALVIGVGLWGLGRLEEAIANLARASSPEADCFLGQCYLEVGFYEKAADAFERAQRGKGATKRVASLGHAEATLKAGRTEPALTELRAVGKAYPDDPQTHYVLGLGYDQAGRYDDATAEYERALELAPSHGEAPFRLGFNAALRGDEDRALGYYEAIAAGPVAYPNALINLGVLYEDRRQYSKAIECFRSVVRMDPNHTRGRMFLKDAHASLDMVYDEDRQRELDRRAQLLSVPVSDFELSVRVRNCLQRMNIHTIGDLVRHTEEELLGSKNFGETSLQEIKEMLAARNLHLGLGREEPEAPPAEAAAEAEVPPTAADETALNIPITDLDLSLRSRKCMERLGITTVGDLVVRTAEDLLASRNFGRTSLAEIAEKLARYGLGLKESPIPADEETEAEGEPHADAQ